MQFLDFSWKLNVLETNAKTHNSESWNNHINLMNWSMEIFIKLEQYNKIKTNLSTVTINVSFKT